MKLLEPRRKRRVTAAPRTPFPVQIESETGIPASRALWQVYTGVFNGDCVVVDDPDEMDIVYNMGFFGKGSLSRGSPEFGKVKKGLPPYLRNRQWLRRKEWAEEQEKYERAALNSKCDQKHQMAVDGGDADKPTVEIEEPAVEIAEPGNSDITVLATGKSGESPQSTKNMPDKKDSVLSDVITLEASDTDSTRTSSAGPVSDSVKSGLKEADVVVLSDDEAPKRYFKQRSQEEIEVIDDSSSNDVVCKADVHASGSDGGQQSSTARGGNVTSTTTDVQQIGEGERDTEPRAKKRRVGPAEDVVEIEDVEREDAEGGDSRDSTAVVTLQDDSRSGKDDSRSGKDAGDGSDAEDSDAETPGPRPTSQVLVLPDSDSDDDDHRNYARNVSARLEQEQFPVRETLHLSLEEAFFLSYGLGCLQVLDVFGSALSLVDLWRAFRDLQKDFVPKYVAYHYLRAKGWVVRSGLKYGGDFMLYRQGPVFYHASYVVVVEVLRAEDWSRHPALNSRSFSWGSMTTLNRVVTAAGKELLACQVVWPAGVPDDGPASPASLPQFAVNEVLTRRWVPSEEREKDREGADWDGQ
ncbi:tRNA-splicing endonuclease subunit Sen2 [Bacillus rossius redtenbacheri]|uniref:tRNA-splicing endonuclease subunit Sen2 n=1 Tax=Bacillus rossius redtenbacheri TaxID=93214 RepID=UPI002FDDC94A